MQGALRQLQSSLDRIRDIANDIDAHAGDALRDPVVRARHETTQCSCTVILSGYFESFLRDTAEGCAADICALRMPFVALDTRIREAHFEEGALVLNRVAHARKTKKVTWVSATAEDIARRLHSVSSAATNELVWEAFAETRASPGPDVIRDFLHRFGVRKAWDRIASKTPYSSSWLVDALNNFIRVRNECAHTGTAAVIPLPSDLRQFCALLDTLATALVAVLQDHVAAVAQAAAPATSSNPVGSSPGAAAATPARTGGGTP
jgi:hypothetical protein